MSDTIRDQWTGTGSSLYVACRAGQSFIASSSFTMTELRLRLARGATYIATDVIIDLYNTDEAHEPTTLISNIGTINTSTLSTSFATQFFTGLSLEITEGTEYAIVIRITGAVVCISGDLTENNNVRVEGSSGYSNGVGWHKLCALNGTWACQLNWTGTGSDWYFRTYGTDIIRQVENPTPLDTDTGITLTPRLQWEVSGEGLKEGDSFDVYLKAGDANFGPEDLLRNVTDLDVQIISGPTYNTLYFWQVVPFSEEGDLLGADAWSFTTILFLPPAVSVDGSGNPTGVNNMVTLKRLVTASNNKVFYET